MSTANYSENEVNHYKKFIDICEELTVSDFMSYFNNLLCEYGLICENEIESDSNDNDLDKLNKIMQYINLFKEECGIKYKKHYKDYIRTYHSGMNTCKNIFLNNDMKSYLIDIIDCIMCNNIQRIVIINDTIITTALMLLLDHMINVYGFDKSIDKNILNNIYLVMDDETAYNYSQFTMSDNIVMCSIDQLDNLRDNCIDSSIRTVFVEVSSDENIDLLMCNDLYQSNSISSDPNLFVFVINNIIRYKDDEMHVLVETVKSYDITEFNYNYLSVIYDGCFDTYYSLQDKYIERHCDNMEYFCEYLHNMMK